MRIFSKIAALFLAAAIGLSSFGQIQSTSSDYIFHYSDGQGMPVFVDVSARTIWGVLNLDNSSSLISVSFYIDSKEDKKNGSEAELALESYLKKFTSIYLLLTRTNEGSPTVRELLYPFHFYF